MNMVRATIRDTAARAADWERVFGSRQIPIKSPVPHRGSAPGHASAEFYELALEQLSPEQRERLVHHLAERFEIPPAEVYVELRRHGYVPILAEDVSVSIDARCIL